jgi:hypothetical protein
VPIAVTIFQRSVTRESGRSGDGGIKGAIGMSMWRLTNSLRGIQLLPSGDLQPTGTKFATLH